MCCASFVMMMMLHQDTCSFRGKIKRGLAEVSIIQIKNELVKNNVE